MAKRGDIPAGYIFAAGLLVGAGLVVVIIGLFGGFAAAEVLVMVATGLTLMLLGLLVAAYGNSQRGQDGGDGPSSDASSDIDGIDGGDDSDAEGGDTVVTGEEGQGGACFAAGTLVTLADGTSKPIERIALGERVLSRNEHTGRMSARRVSRLFVHGDEPTTLLTLTGHEALETTDAHRFFVAEQGFIGAGALSAGARLGSAGGAEIRVAAIAPAHRRTTVYNLEVERDHTYFVGTQAVWVHNKKDTETEG